MFVSQLTIANHALDAVQDLSFTIVFAAVDSSIFFVISITWQQIVATAHERDKKHGHECRRTVLLVRVVRVVRVVCVCELQLIYVRSVAAHIVFQYAKLSNSLREASRTNFI
jgi:hypothetical protein